MSVQTYEAFEAVFGLLIQSELVTRGLRGDLLESSRRVQKAGVIDAVDPDTSKQEP